jgi:hypothetical protein
MVIFVDVPVALPPAASWQVWVDIGAVMPPAARAVRDAVRDRGV